MKIVIITQWFSERMGYAENLLPKALAKQGVEVHVISSTAQIYYNSPKYKEVYESFIGPNILETGKKQIDGYTLHRLPIYKPGIMTGSGPGIKGLMELLQELKPDVIQVFEIEHVETYTAAYYCKKTTGCKLFTECHVHASVLRKGNHKSFSEKINSFINFLNPRIRLIKNTSHLTYAIAEDVKDIVLSYYHFPVEKVIVQSLGVDCDIFSPVLSDMDREERALLRTELGISNGDVLCIYTGRFTRDKMPHCLAEAINYLHQEGYVRYKAIFLGSGTQEDISFIQSQSGCRILPFVPMDQLPRYYRASDIGVWPREESTSQLDAIACGLPVILSNRIKVTERVEGNGLMYEEGNFKDLADKILSLDNETRKKMSLAGIKKAKELFSWDSIAKERISHYLNC